jgi:hypothetical protein
MIYFAALLSIITVDHSFFAVFYGLRGGSLQAASAVDSIDSLDAMKSAILERYLDDEKAFKAKQISKITWQQRRAYLVNRYVDTVRRIDYLNYHFIFGINGSKSKEQGLMLRKLLLSIGLLCTLPL